MALERVLVFESPMWFAHLLPERNELEITPKDRAGNWRSLRELGRIRGKKAYGYYDPSDKYCLLRYYDPDHILPRELKASLRAHAKKLFTPVPA